MDSSFTRRPLIACLEQAMQRHASLPALVTPAREESAQRPRDVPPTGDDRPGEADRVVTSGDLWEQVGLLADGLRSLGLTAGEKVLLLSENRERWLVADLALLALGCPDVPRGTEAPAEEVAYIAQKVRARVAFVEKPELLKKLGPAAKGIELVILLTGAPPPATGGARVIRFDDVLALADPAAAAGRLHESIAQRRCDETATIVFTSGTTGRPKGALLTQQNLASNLHQVLSHIDFLPAGARFLSILPSWHMFERMVEYALLSLGLEVIYSDRRHFGKDLARVRPAVLAAVPRLWMMVMEGVLAKVEAAPPGKRRLVRAAFAVATRQERRRRFKTRRSFTDLLLAPLDLVLRPLVLSKIATALGVQELKRGLAISGGGTLPDHVDLFFACLGIELVNGYGLTETSPVLSLRPPGENVGGTVGPPLAQTEIRIHDPESGAELAPGSKGVLHVRGPQVMPGYFEEEQATAAVFTRDGWFNTGDLAFVTPAGHLVITGRAKDTIVLLSGENVEPEPLENALTSSPLIEQAVVVGQDRKFLAALIVPRQREEAAEPATLHAALRREIDERVSPRQGFRGHERIVRFKLLDRPLSVEDGFLSQTMKVKRAVVQERLRAEIDSLFESGAQHGDGGG